MRVAAEAPAEERRIREAALDETLANTFPASDPPSSIPNPHQHDASKEKLAPNVIERGQQEADWLEPGGL